jgi:hypothetical protein
VRKAKNLLIKQIENYKNDQRAVFVYTFTRENIDEVKDAAEELVAHGCKLTFNVFSSPVGYTGNLRHDDESFARTRQMMIELLNKYPQNVLFSVYNAVAHTHTKSLHDLYSCSYPRRNPSQDIGLGRSFRQYRTDLNWDRSVACGSAVVTARLYRHVNNADTFKSWLDYVDTYLAVWVMGYEKGENLCAEIINPPNAAAS